MGRARGREAKDPAKSRRVRARPNHAPSVSVTADSLGWLTSQQLTNPCDAGYRSPDALGERPAPTPKKRPSREWGPLHSRNAEVRAS